MGDGGHPAAAGQRIGVVDPDPPTRRNRAIALRIVMESPKPGRLQVGVDQAIMLFEFPGMTGTATPVEIAGGRRRGAGEPRVASGGGNPNIHRRIGAILAILLGALTGGLLVLHTGLALPLALAGLITLGATVALAHDLPADA